MKKRSITKILTLNFLTLGFYEVIWIFETRQEMVTKYGVQIPSAKTVGVVYWFQWVAVILALVALGMSINQSNKISTLPPVTPPSKECFIDYVGTNGPNAVPASKKSTLCKTAFDGYYSASDKRSSEEAKVFWYAGAFFILGFAALSSVFVSVRWLKHYAAGVEVVTRGKISKNRALQYLSSLPPYLRIPLIQEAFNNSEPSVPAGAQPEYITPRG